MKTLLKSRCLVAPTMLIVGATLSAQVPPRAEPPKATISLEDQFERKHDISQFRGDVLVLLYGDREGMPSNRGLGEKLHVHYHPAAKGMSPGEASKAPASPIAGAPQGARSPDVRVVPVACISQVPDLVKDFIRGRVKKEAPETMVLLDFDGTMKDQFGMKEGQPNLVVIDVAGRVRLKVSGELDGPTYTSLIQAIDYLRKEGVK